MPKSAATNLEVGRFNVVDLARKFGTPLYIMDASKIRTNYQSIQRAFEREYEKVIVCYAYKANSHLAVCNILRNIGAGAEVASGGELYIALKVGVPPHKIVFDGPNKSINELKLAIESKVYINADSPTEVRKIDALSQELNTTTHLGIRVNPAITVKTHPHLSTGQPQHKFGVPLDQALELFENIARMANVKLVGLQTHIGSEIAETTPFQYACNSLLKLAKRLRERLGIDLKYLDIGGGLALPHNPSRNGHRAYDRYARAIGRTLKTGLSRNHLCHSTLIIEPGREIVANAGILLTEVGVVKRAGPVNWAIVDAGMNHLIRPVLYGAYHPIVVANKLTQASTEKFWIGGPCCESGDVLARNRRLPKLQPGDYLAILEAGAYGFTMSSNYNAFPRPAVVLVDGENANLIRERETYEYMFEPEHIPSLPN